MAIWSNINFDALSDSDLDNLERQFGLSPITSSPETENPFLNMAFPNFTSAPITGGPSSDVTFPTFTSAPITGGPSSDVTLSPDVQNLVTRAFEASRSLGAENLRRAATESAGQRGLNLTDTPISDPYMRSLALLESQTASGRANAILDLLQRNRLLGEQARQFNVGTGEQARQFNIGTGQQAGRFLLGLGEQGRQFNVGAGEQARQFNVGLGEQARRFQLGLGEQARQFNVGQEFQRFGLNESIRQFQEELRQRAFQNRLNLAQQFGATGLGLAGTRFARGTGGVTTSPLNTALGFNLLSGGGAQLGRSIDRAGGGPIIPSFGTGATNFSGLFNAGLFKGLFNG